jgi:hypothetical protein
MSNQVRIKTDELPLRARNLSPSEVSKVFGGCADTCTQDSECCGGQRCKYYSTVAIWQIPVYKCQW